mmetsp:Transcript_58435/g.138996  ORF Transcript_58435/g.138996 Transcript_58435/m.138996 type:complete len:201 (+) Transcript_58435:1120-1722(+)
MYSVSRPAKGLTRHEAEIARNVWSRHAWLQAMQVLISSSLFSSALRMKCGSARNGRAIETMSAWPSRSTCSATEGMLMRFVVTSGIDTSPLSFCVTHENAARGTHVAIVGIRASCHPMPVLMMVTPAFSSSFARVTTSLQSEPFSTRSSIESRKMMIKSLPTFSRMARTISRGRRIRFSYDPPHSSTRWFTWAAMNWFRR